MNRSPHAGLLISLAAAAGILALSFRAAPAQVLAARRERIARGKYLVDGVAMCSECHTPRDERGELDGARYLQGAPTWITPVHPRSEWADRAPALAGLGSYSEEQAEEILEKGAGPNGLPLRAPMHVYRMDPADAAAVVAYLKSLPASPMTRGGGAPPSRD